MVVGGGLAGLAAALELVDADHDVTLIEARPSLGGAVQTLPEREGDPSPPPDNGQHIALGCCTEYLDFLDRIGQLQAIRRERLRLPVISEDGTIARLGPGATDLLRYRHVSLRERLRIATIAQRIGRLDPDSHDGETFAELLTRFGQRQEAIDRFWEVFIRPALNLPSSEASAQAGVFTAQTALLGPREASDLLLPVAPLGPMHGGAARRELEAKGARIETRIRAERVEEGRVTTADGDHRDADAIVVAVPPAESARILGDPVPTLEDSPIVSIHLLFDRRILREPMAALLGSPAHWIFDRGWLTGRPARRGQYLTVVSSGVPDLLEIRGRDLVALMTRELNGRLGWAELLWSRVSREPGATFAVRPGTANQRLGVDTRIPSVTRAGAWTATGWPATMEGAIRSGRRAARVLISRVPERARA